MTELPAGPTKFIHVNPAAIKANARKPQDKRQPVCVVRCEDISRSCFRVDIHGPSTLEYEPARNSGAKVRIHTTAAITLHTDAPRGS